MTPRWYEALMIAVAAALALGAVAVAVGGCGGAPRVGRVVVLAAAEAVVAVDEATAGEHAAAAARALDAASTLPEYRAAMVPWDALTVALGVARSTVRAADAALDAWDAGGSERWLALAGCVAASLVALAEAIEAAGVALPAELAAALSLAASLGAATCGGA